MAALQRHPTDVEVEQANEIEKDRLLADIATLAARGEFGKKEAKREDVAQGRLEDCQDEALSSR
ncbi:hypothetical protein Pmar_PMAR027655 [Perkinsus marinus ATCC 50983]|uniref:Uncharacterized protein n=1 Tax=Perkinsus marinus (strain ATCC 50983 / TXsc) TaxID=423536 RepID=C5KCC5_PERM5|nr:hypothetical protein Pmar_PMAR027655 [Perkinsus marinus ATCC 50983]EER17938.1 hypothetical protein Pmar_PMAR027655 [Perkinsus marinus ATCC 50983]|eukprot:XP_002786142.1 hypothetical protein Pmar_PMAR027655 [Perkinsus marinus ATCC 50983]